MSAAINITNYQFGDLLAIKRVGSDKYKQALWLCQCSCGNTRIVRYKDLKSQKITHCGCKNKTTVKDLTNQRFGRLIVKSRYSSDNSKKATWICQCDCGKETIVRGSDLLSNKINSCGCYKSAKYSRDLSNQKFGKLTAIKIINKSKYGNIWLCKCDCGKEFKTTENHLITGNTQSCGCLISKGENKIIEWLSKHNINFIQQYTFNDLVGRGNRPLRFDIAILINNKLSSLIEYQGIQHYKNIYNLNQSDWERAVKYDELKRLYCKEHNIPLYEIKYDENIEKKLENIFK